MLSSNAANRGFMEVEDWDFSTRILTGLHLGPTPADTHRAYDLRSFEKYPDGKVQHELKTIAVRLYNHQKMTPMFAGQVSNGKNTLAYLLCASYEPSQSSSPRRNGRPRLRNCTPLPLAYWDRLYYAICAEIRKMYGALQGAFGEVFERGGTVLHNAGPEGVSGSPRHPFSAIGLASLLEDMMAAVTDYRLLGALDLAVRIRHAQDKGSDDDMDDDNDVLRSSGPNEDGGDFWNRNLRSYKHTHDESCHCVAIAEGLVDVHATTPDQIIEMVWAKQAAESKRKSGRCSEDQTLLGRCRAEVREVSPRASSNSPRGRSKRPTAHCSCDAECYCREVCALEKNECGCTHMRNQMRDIVDKQMEVLEAVQEKSNELHTTLPHNMLGAANNDVAQLQVAAVAPPHPYMVQACYATSEAADKLDKEMLEKHRKRANTGNSDLAYVPPPRTPSRAKKDAYPLGFYGDSSGQRYPAFRSNVIDDVPPPVYGASFYSSEVPARKPVPRSAFDDDKASSPLDRMPIGQVTYPTIPASESQGHFTQSFAVAAKGNPRNADVDQEAAAYTDLAQEAHNAIRPFSDEPMMYTGSTTATSSSPNVTLPHTRPDIFTAATSPNVITIPKSRTKALDLVNKPVPALPQPDFINPKPAAKQRYVSAGGTAKLSDRQEITGPAFATQLASQSSGAAIPKEELFQMLSDPNFVRANFGEDAVGKMSTSGGDRPSVSTESSPSKSACGSGLLSQRTSGQESQRGSAGSLVGLGKGGDKRERTDSGTSTGSGRFGKLKRVFSRKNSECE